MDAELLKKVLADRSGKVIGAQTILKSDHYGAAANKKITSSRVAGAPNFRCVNYPDTKIPVFAVGQPTVFGIRAVMNVIQVDHGKDRPILWINLREEPVIYINKRPYVLRESDFPLRNMAIYSGVASSSLESMESRIKEDILHEASKYGGNILIHEEEDGEVIPCWEAVTTDNVQTPREVYDSLTQAEYKVTYARLPLTPEGPIKRKKVDTLLELIKTYSSTHSIIFNCQMGLGRSTLGMIIACLYHVNAHRVKVDYVNNHDEKHGELAPYYKGEYAMVLSLTRLMEDGKDIKSDVDYCVDRCGLLHNIRETIFLIREQAETARTTLDTQALLSSGANYLARYVHLIALNNYLREQSPKLDVSFNEWTAQHHEFYTVIKTITSHPERALRLNLEKLDTTQERFIKARKGNVLGPGSIIKSDVFPGLYKKDISQVATGAPNFRKAINRDIFACAAPTAEGIINAVKYILNTSKNKKIIWINLREEPVCYINGNPYSLRQAEFPMRNFSIYTGISAEHVDKMERRLKQDVLTEVEENGKKLYTHEENESMEVNPVWCDVSSVQTPREVFTELLSQLKVELKYTRLPITTEQPPEIKDFDDLLTILEEYDDTTSVIMNCQIGVGRSTTGMVMCYLVDYWKKHSTDSLAAEQFKHYYPSEKTDFPITSSLVRLLSHGHRTKMQVDWAIDNCGETQNLRLSINDILKKSEGARRKEELRAFTKRAAKYAERYFYLIAFNAYLAETFETKFKPLFTEWMENRREITTLLQELFHDPEKALIDSVHIDEEDVSTFIGNRSGNVLSSGTLLKADHFPGCQNNSLPISISGAPNFRQVSPDIHVYGVAIPTEDGIKNVLNHLNAGPTGVNNVVWINLREEPVMYVNGRPYVIRSVNAPYENLAHTGITVSRVEEMEVRLKEDIRQEISTPEHYNKVLLHDEAGGRLMAKFEEILDFEANIMTPKEYYASITKEGYRVKYYRIAITDEQAPKMTDFDDLFAVLKTLSPETHVIFNCQMGRGRTTTGTVIATMLAASKLHVNLGPAPKSNAEYKTIVRVTRMLTNGTEDKQFADKVIDMCSAMQNLREAIKTLKNQEDAATDPDKKEFAHIRAVNYLKRYFHLILFASYVKEQEILPAEEAYKIPFGAWFAQRPEYETLLHKNDVSEVDPDTVKSPAM
jgi:protein-tyrosine phosphatase